jgi:hypothetical protein
MAAFREVKSIDDATHFICGRLRPPVPIVQSSVYLIS